jgi:hypothetical protein
MLILASDGHVIYRQLEDVWRYYMKSNPNVDCYFYKGDPSLQDDYILKDDTLYIKIKDSLDTVYEKTLRAFRYFENDLYKYDFVYRTNMSSFVILNKYVDYCESLPRNRFVSAVVGNYGSICFPSGSGFTITPDLVAELIHDNPQLIEQDDVTIGAWMLTKCIPIIPVSRIDFIYDSNQSCIQNSEIMPTESIFHYRIKNINRENDIVIHRRLLAIFYGSG